MSRTNLDDDRVIIERRSGSSMSALLAGIAIGAGLALLFAPQSGEETRQLMRRKARRARRLAGDYTNDLKDRAYDIRERATRVVGETRERGRDLVEGAREKIEDTLDDTRRAIRDKRRELGRAVDEGRAAARDARHDLERRLADAQRTASDGPIPGQDASAD
jgi:gas vesicle protein